MRASGRVASFTSKLPSNEDPIVNLLSAAAALEAVYRQIRETGSSLGSSAPLYSFAEMNRLMGFKTMWRFDKEHTEI
jgi:hypothetical protein